ncbi:12651_t:CDS:2 [Ambispora gerdemannii]|uniref:12651_t:CDS:1 n=1 Tax=Ambispora gerdemannii TaxID=144530 RepID=A0A9N9ANB6_9GLOM|nr:12651_t:CDS:2 [Ambispora gerdemannii]
MVGLVNKSLLLDSSPVGPNGAAFIGPNVAYKQNKWTTIFSCLQFVNMNTTISEKLNSQANNDNGGSELCAVCATGVISNGSVTLAILWILAKKNANGIDTCLVLNLLIADWLQSMGFIMSLYWVAINEITPGLYCNIQGVIMSIGGMGSVSWVTLITIYTFLVVVYSKQPKKYYAILSIPIVWLTAIFLSLTYLLVQKPEKPFFATVGGNSTFCWIADEYDRSWVYIIYMSILLSSIALIIILHGIMFCFIYRYSTRAMFRRTAVKLILYSVCYVMLTLPLCSYLLSGHFGLPTPYPL